MACSTDLILSSHSGLLDKIVKGSHQLGMSNVTRPSVGYEDNVIPLDLSNRRFPRNRPEHALAPVARNRIPELFPSNKRNATRKVAPRCIMLFN